jgi:hypothetical protein
VRFERIARGERGACLVSAPMLMRLPPAAIVPSCGISPMSISVAGAASRSFIIGMRL